ncbi:MAG: phosphate acyltransferase PlsX [Candidatus Caenarcaniphilales bacterium]|nr:phosphate acyltransferase PlsX [Candidatus Caenarcaniphilales bacterium]
MSKASDQPNRLIKKAVIRGTRFLKKHAPLNAESEKELPEFNHRSRPVVAVDAMGGDYAPLEIVKGSLRAARELDIAVQLVGPTERIQTELRKYDDWRNLPVEIISAEEYLEMDEKQPAVAVRRKPGLSINVAMRQVSEGKADAFVGAGSTGGVAASALFTLKRIKGIERPGIGAVVPTSKGQMILVDAGANVDSTPYQMAQHAIMGSIFASIYFGIESPQIGLLNIGEEPSKGNHSAKNTFSVLEKLKTINFVGNVEGRTIAEHYCDVLVADGFVGNVFLKTAEGSVKMAFQIMHQELTKSLDLKMGALICRPAFRAIKHERLNYAKYGGAILLGVHGVVVVAHGISNDFAIMNAIKLAAESTRSRIVRRIEDALKTDELDALVAESE